VVSLAAAVKGDAVLRNGKLNRHDRQEQARERGKPVRLIASFQCKKG